ncbi:MAG: hypothetical protein H0W67_08400, partial [Gemmatimonadales bacterium]|nr:hypothetical protein [Gemmatimonadales bacterium]
MTRIAGTLVLGVLLASALPLASLRAQQGEPVRITPLAAHLYLLTGPGGNSLALTGPDGVMLMDQQFPSPSPAVRAALGSVSRGPAKGLQPDIAFSQVIAFAFDGEDVHAVHLGPAHARGD